jgi:ribonuclease HI
MDAPIPDPDGTPIVVYTDGSCLGNPGPGGWGWAVDGGPTDSGGESHSTNQRMEVLAVIRALETLPGPVHVVSDSTYVVNCFRQRWHVGWLRRSWKNSQGKPVANRDLWEKLFALALDPDRPVTFEWVKGHSGDRMNDVVDALATAAAARQDPSGPPPDTGFGQGQLLP